MYFEGGVDQNPCTMLFSGDSWKSAERKSEVAHIVQVSAFSLSWPDCDNYAVFNCEPLEMSWGANHLNSCCLCHNSIAEPRLFEELVLSFNDSFHSWVRDIQSGSMARLQNSLLSYTQNIQQCKAIAHCQAVLANVCVCVWVNVWSHTVHLYMQEITRESITAH